MSKNKVEVDCTSRCHSQNHGQALTSAITKRSVTDVALASFIKSTCANFVKVFDDEGRTALHMAASRGRTELVNWIIRHSPEAFVNARDLESGYTPLHRSIFYGQIHAAVALIKSGVNTDILDKDDYKAIEHAMLDRQYMPPATGPLEAYAWGSNSNYTLGTGSQQQRSAPELLACFSRAAIQVRQVCLGKFHTVFLCSGASEGEVWCCGQLARAGGPHCTALKPVQLRLSEPVVDVAVTLDSTVFLLESGMVVQYSLNSADSVSQSGAKAPPSIRLPSVKPLMKLSSALGVRCGRAHAALWSGRALYTWGANLGQLGHAREDRTLSAPKRVAISMNNEESSILLVEAGDAATALTTSRGDVYLLHKYMCKKIAVKQINIRQVCVEAKVSEQGVYSRVTVLLLTTVGQLLIWQDTTNRLTRCVFGLAHQTSVTHAALTHDALYFTTKYGEAFIGAISRKGGPPQPQPQPVRREKKEEREGKSALVKFLEKDDCTSVRVSKIPNVYRATAVAVDSEGLNFACLQSKPTGGLTAGPRLSPSSLNKHLQALLDSAAEDDLLHDVVYKVGNKTFPLHLYIVASSSELLYRLALEARAAPAERAVPLDNVHPEVFARIVQYMYTGGCDVTAPGACALRITKDQLIGKKEDIEGETENDNPSEVSAFEVYKSQDKRKSRRSAPPSARAPPPGRAPHCDPVKLVQAAAKRLQVLALHKLLDKFYYRDGTVYAKDGPPAPPAVPRRRTALPELVDTHVCSKDGVSIAAHKCVLAARLDYFNGMFMHSWTESKLLSKVTLPINHGILLPVVDFLYTDTCPELDNCDSIDFICNLLIVADQLFITRLREMCEVALANLITLKNCAELCQFAHTYNATQLKQSCMEFIALNLCSVLENRLLDLVEDALLNDVTAYYCKFNPIMGFRVVTPFSNAPSDETIEECARSCPVDLSVTDEDMKRDDSLGEASKRKKNPRKIEYTDSEKERKRYESVSSVTSLDLSNDLTGDITLSLQKIGSEEKVNARGKQDKWIEVPSAQQKQQKVVQARLKAISTARDILNEAPVESFTKLGKSSAISISSPDTPTSSRASVSPRDSPLAESARSPQGNFIISHIGPKLSQKQRKKLAMQSGDQPQNLEDFLANKLSVGSPPEPRNPWKQCGPPQASPAAAKPVEFNKILTDQKKQKEDFSRIMTKPLTMTQLEDKAIEQLERFYNVHEIDDELITVRRIALQVSSPQWLHTAPK